MDGKTDWSSQSQRTRRWKQREKEEGQEGKYKFKWGPLNMDVLSSDNGWDEV